MPSCRSCSAPIFWATTAKGKAIPLDVEPRADGNIEVRARVAHYVTPDLNAVGTRRYVSHFATCAQAAQFRKARP